jgi:Spy/CpxP family protein refolding chaperone
MLALSSRTKALLLAALIFLVGGVCGAIATRRAMFKQVRRAEALMQRRGPARGPQLQQRWLRGLTRDLDLSEEQEARVREILDESRERTRSQRRDVNRRLRTTLDSTQAKILDVLTDEQRLEYDKNRQRFQRLWRRRPRPAGRP